jgi:hypothetical protein
MLLTIRATDITGEAVARSPKRGISVGRIYEEPIECPTVAALVLDRPTACRPGQA